MDEIMAKNFEDIKISRSNDGDAVRITLNRPEKKNALSKNLLREIEIALGIIQDDKTVKVLVFTGEGDSFTSGYDLSPSNDVNTENTYDEFLYEKESYDIIKKVWDFPLPTIGKINGYALAGGFELSQMMDIVIASEEAEFGYPIVRGQGTPPIFFLPFIVNHHIARELIFTGRTVDGTEAAEIGLANTVVPSDELDQSVNEMIKNIRKVPSDILRLNKRQMNRSVDIMGFTDSVERAIDLHMTGHDAPSPNEFNNRLEEQGLRETLRWRDEEVKER